MKPIAATLAALSLAACSAPRTADYADSATTAVAISQGATEANPVVGVAGDSAAPVVALGAKVVVRSLVDNSGLEQEQKDLVHDILSAGGWGATCNNVAVYAGVSGPAAPALGLMCALIAYES